MGFIRWWCSRFLNGEYVHKILGNSWHKMLMLHSFFWDLDKLQGNFSFQGRDILVSGLLVSKWIGLISDSYQKVYSVTWRRFMNDWWTDFMLKQRLLFWKWTGLIVDGYHTFYASAHMEEIHRWLVNRFLYSNKDFCFGSELGL
jgi:hypothetical protein